MSAPVRSLEELEARVASLEGQLKEVNERLPSDRLTVVAFSRELDRALTGLIMATAAAALGSEVSIFFAFWGLTLLKKKTRARKKALTQRLLDQMLPAGPAGLSQMHLLGVGTTFVKRLMKSKSVQSVDDLIEIARESGVRFIACSMSMDVMGLTAEDLIDGVEVSGVTTFLTDACDSRVSLFI